jgi:cell wall-associated NlpC family hydrolase
MKKIFIVFLLAVGSLKAQTHQKELLSFVDSHIGKKIGKGYCYELVQGAIRQYIPNCDMRSMDVYGKKIDMQNIQPGDLVRISGKDLKHIAIIYKIENGKIFVAEQNTRDKLSESVVEINPLRKEWLVEYYDAKFSFYRPE